MKTIAAAFIKAKKEFSPALKDKTNPAFRSKYADLGACLEAVNDALLNNGIGDRGRVMPRNFGLRSARHAALDLNFPPDTPPWLANTEEETMSLPAARRINFGRTFPKMWDAASYGAALERPAPKVWDALCWVAAFALLALAFTAPWWLR